MVVDMEEYYYDETSPSGLRHSYTKAPNAPQGSVAGCKNNDGYYRIHLNGKLVMNHRYIWELFNEEIPDGMIVDHIDCNPENNILSNLRLATMSENSYNNGSRKNKDGLPKGMRFKNKNSIQCNITTCDGRFTFTTKSFEEATEWLNGMREKYHKEFSNKGNNS